ncbi:succinate dehydrogenase assembly factor 2 [Nitrosomonas ureae]|uniref:FAD assembly factor SdhE n=1 Tax=Nitrosomonas ureae TaxID=44577 RepID=A0A1H9GLY1_9PROT|nr:succinate dehydrogenase assembly factor 2 [Nitrosomonas ureae]PTQ81759.1 antitoxin CptB [Nitrosomonas ureae]SEQ51013.1 antitoxin CptB [Nitrosomonas ureae]SOD20850.1 antitoxin CptB [Nitrosomonas ureae]
MKEFERARWRCRRGMLELDIVLQRFMDQNYRQLDEAGLLQFERLLALPDNDLWDLISGKQVNCDTQWQPILELLQKN